MRSNRIFSHGVLLALLLMPLPLLANPTQEEVFKSISDNMGKKSDNSHFIAGVAAVAGAAILVAVISKRNERRVVKPPSRNHPAKLMREVVRATSLRPAEVRLLRHLAERESVKSPLTLVLCPSVLVRAAKAGTTRAERKVLVQLGRKMGLGMAAGQRR